MQNLPQILAARLRAERERTFALLIVLAVEHPGEGVHRRIIAQLKCLAAMVKQFCDIPNSNGMIGIAYGVRDAGAGAIAVRLIDHFEEELGLVRSQVARQLAEIAKLLLIDPKAIAVTIDAGPLGTPAGGGPCAKDLRPTRREAAGNDPDIVWL